MTDKVALFKLKAKIDEQIRYNNLQYNTYQISFKDWNHYNKRMRQEMNRIVIELKDVTI